MSRPEQNDDTLIPDVLKTAAAEIAAVCRKHNLGRLSGTIRPSFRVAPDLGEVEMEWAEGRHGVDKDQMRIKFSKNIYIDIDTTIGG